MSDRYKPKLQSEEHEAEYAFLKRSDMSFAQRYRGEIIVFIVLLGTLPWVLS